MNIDPTIWATVALMHFVAVISPGPDFAIVLKQSLQKGLRAALWTSIGIGVGILVHVTYSILGLSIIIKTTPWLFNTLLYIAAAYFAWIGINALLSKPNNGSMQTAESELGGQSVVWYKAFALGFLVNALNPKATLFFLALFTASIPPNIPFLSKVFYGGYFATATAAWFCFLSYICTHKRIREAYQRHGHWFDRVMGVVLIVMAILLIWP